MPDEQYDIFISYSRADYYARETIWQRLKDAGFKIWVDQRKIRFGEAWRKAIESALKHSKCVVYLASPDSNVSKWAQEELALAQKLRLPIFPVLVRGDEFPFGLNQLQYLDATKGIQKSAADDFVETIRATIQEGAPVETLSPPLAAELPSGQPLPSELMIVLLRVLEAAADLASTQKNVARASLLWIDENSQELFIAAATYRYQDAELRLRLRKHIGVAGEVWASGATETTITHPRRDIADGAMRQRWNFKQDQISLLKRMGTIISVPILRGENQLVGILSIDTPGELTQADLDAKHVLEEASDFGIAIANMPIEEPFPYHKYRSMHSVIRAARLIPPYAEPSRAAIFWATDDYLYMIAGSEEISGRWNLCDQHFRKNQGIVGQVWATGKILSDNRSGKTHKQIKEDWNLTNDQFELVRDVKSIIAAPVFIDGDEVIAVLVIGCTASMTASRLDDYRVTVNELAQLAAKVLASQ